ncbi:MAG TPA: ATP-binding protein [Syntrophales bacterium]|nr:ATP-binding protein [Syntrophales bacterium]
MLGLRHKLLLGFGGLLLIIALIGLQSITKVTTLGGAIDVILKENYQRVLACQDMKESLERMDSGALFILSGSEKEGREAIDVNVPVFEKALQIELNTITLPGEGEKAAHLKELFERYKTMIQVIGDKTLSSERRRQIYYTDLFPLFREIKDTANSILTMNQQNMYDENQSARHKAARAREQMYFLLLLGAIVAIAYMFLIGKWILRPINRLTQSVDEIKQGNLDLVVTSNTRDEIGHLSAAFNEMTASLREIRRSEELKLVRMQHSTQETFNNLPDVAATIDLEGRVEVSTETAKNIFGLNRGVQIQILPYKWMADLFRKALSGDQTSTDQESISLIQQFINTEEHYFRPIAAPILNNRKEVTGVILILKDVTEQLEHDELKRGVISTVSHQLKTPLTSIRMALHLLLDEKLGPLTAKQADLLITAREDSDRLNRILENLLDLSRIVSGKVAMELHTAQPHQLVLESIESYRAASRQRGIELKTELPDDLPDVRADTLQIAHAFANLLFNALKYTESGGTVTVSAQADEGHVRFLVSDTGKGIPEQYLPRVFDRFFRVPGQETESGIGLGLAIVKEIIEAHGGSVSAESRVGEGSTFSFTLPRADKAAEDESA